jgi:hypothetical protein
MRQFTIPKIPKQNGVANCKNQILVECARSMLQQSKLSKKILAKVVGNSCLCQNIVPYYGNGWEHF